MEVKKQLHTHICIAPGSINIDLIFKTDMLKGPKTFRGQYRECQGGKGANEAVAVTLSSNREREVYLVGCVGNDIWGKQAIKNLKDWGVNTDFIKIVDNCRTGVVVEYLYGDGQVDIGIDLGANSELTMKDIDNAEQVIKNAKILLSQIENSIEVIEYSIRLAKFNGVTTFLDPSVVPDGGHERKILFERILPNVDIIAPNRSEAKALTGVMIQDKSFAMQAAQILLEEVDTVIITMGREGVFVANGRDHHIVPGIKVNSIDGGAVGDTFRGVFCEAIVEMLEEINCGFDDLSFEHLIKAAEFANYAAALGITRQGTHSAMPTRNEIEEFIEYVKCQNLQ